MCALYTVRCTQAQQCEWIYFHFNVTKSHLETIFSFAIGSKWFFPLFSSWCSKAPNVFSFIFPSRWLYSFSILTRLRPLNHQKQKTEIKQSKRLKSNSNLNTLTMTEERENTLVCNPIFYANDTDNIIFFNHKAFFRWMAGWKFAIALCHTNSKTFTHIH